MWKVAELHQRLIWPITSDKISHCSGHSREHDAGLLRARQGGAWQGKPPHNKPQTLPYTSKFSSLIAFFPSFFVPDSVTEVKTDIYVTSFGPVSDTDMVGATGSSPPGEGWLLLQPQRTCPTLVPRQSGQKQDFPKWQEHEQASQLPAWARVGLIIFLQARGSLVWVVHRDCSSRVFRLLETNW